MGGFQQSSARLAVSVLVATVGCSKSTDAPEALGRGTQAPAHLVERSVTLAATTANATKPSAPPVERAQPTEPPLEPKSDTLEMTFVGDVIFGRYRSTGYDPIPEGDHAIFEQIQPALDSDLLVGNLETPLVYNLPADSPIGSRFRFGASKAMAQHLVRAGFDAVSLANNHWFDMRLEGVVETPKILRELGVRALGAARVQEPLFVVETIHVKGWRVGLIALTTRTNAPQRDGVPKLPMLGTRQIAGTIGPLVERARSGHDVIVVMVHWGQEYADSPSLSQVRAAHALVDAGVDLVIGHHPHVLQTVELYGPGLIAYSLGNFVFENTNDPPRLTGVLRTVFSATPRCLQAALLHPAYIKRLPIQHPVPARGYMGRQVKRRVRALAKRGTKWLDDGADLRLETPTCDRGGTGG